MKSIYETKFDTVIEWIDEHVARGFIRCSISVLDLDGALLILYYMTN